MGWRDVLQLIDSAKGDMDKITTGKIEFATAHGRGEPAIQIRIAKTMYKRLKGVKVKDEQKKWEFA